MHYVPKSSKSMSQSISQTLLEVLVEFVLRLPVDEKLVALGADELHCVTLDVHLLCDLHVRAFPR